MSVTPNLCCDETKNQGTYTRVTSNPSHGTIDVTRVYVPRFFVSSQQRFGATDIKALGMSQLSGLGQTVLQLLGKSVLQLYFI